MNTTVEYTHRHSVDGNVVIGNMSSSFFPTLDKIATYYLSIVPDKSANTHHMYYSDLNNELKEDFDKIQNADFWQGLRTGAFDELGSFASVMNNIVEMNELYYSNPKPKFKGTNLYGAAANLIPHRDCILFKFPGIRVYRAIISTTQGNNDTITEFINHSVEHKLNKGDYMVFDFDRTLHQVKKTGHTSTPRVLLKLHFLVCDTRYSNSMYSCIYIKFASLCYIIYYRVARYTEQLGTDPTTFIGFFFGILWEYPFYVEVRKAALGVYIGVIAALEKTHNVEVRLSNWREVVAYSTLDMFIIYFCIVGWFWVSYLTRQYTMKSSVLE